MVGGGFMGWVGTGGRIPREQVAAEGGDGDGGNDDEEGGEEEPAGVEEECIGSHEVPRVRNPQGLKPYIDGRLIAALKALRHLKA
jgi:hypothetical protein